jgi:hypothetical protein
MVKPVIAVLAALAVSGPLLAAEGQSGRATLHPGAMGLDRSGGNGGGVPAAIFEPCRPGPGGGCPGSPMLDYAGPGGWGGWVSDCASANGGFDPEQRAACVPSD